MRFDFTARKSEKLVELLVRFFSQKRILKEFGVDNISRSKVRRLIFSRNVFVNGKFALNPNEIITLKSRIAVNINPMRFLYEKNVQDAKFVMSEAAILFEDEYFIAINKIANYPVERTVANNAVRDNLHDTLIQYLWKRDKTPNAPYIGMVHRIDRTTSGIILFAKTKEATKALSALFSSHEVKKAYRAICSIATKTPKTSGEPFQTNTQTLKINTQTLQANTQFPQDSAQSLKITAQNPQSSAQSPKITAQTSKSNAHNLQADIQNTHADNQRAKIDSQTFQNNLQGLETKMQFPQADSHLFKTDSQSLQANSQSSQIDNKPTRTNIRTSLVDSHSPKIDSQFLQVGSQSLGADNRSLLSDGQFSQIDNKFPQIDNNLPKVDSRPSKVNSQSSQPDSQPTQLDSQPPDLDSQKPLLNLSKKQNTPTITLPLNISVGSAFTVENYISRITPKSSPCKWGITGEERGLYSKTDFTVEGTCVFNGVPCFVISARLFTGRTHQIRVHLSSVGLPIVGDATYGGLNNERILLHSEHICFVHPFTGAIVDIKMEPDWKI